MDVFAVSHPAVPSSILALSRFIELHCFDSGVWLLIAERNAERGSTNTVGCKFLKATAIEVFSGRISFDRYDLLGIGCLLDGMLLSQLQ